ncbi:PREDICTED: CTD small phosphatase-like protein [Tarenaya hassleriana]|uniref:CTD small phosphatase-like protein n=1 Tax=Tarenaya hassleriana TaxID=28532 RepID=UPI00053C9128|nr:PREDICTED: CTD small phosphatase-like protein [Tarenaya hassleriana]
MAELTQAEVVYSPRSLEVWKALVNWLAFFYQIFLQFLRAVGHLPLLSSSSSSPSGKAAADGFELLPVVEVPDKAAESPASVEIPSRRTCGDRDGHGDGGRFAKLTVVLDLDETLVCAYETSSLPVSLRNQAIEAGLKWFELECVSSEKECEGKPKINYVTVFERPGLHEFLEQLSRFANLVLFTAGLEGYARPLVDRIDTGNLFSLRLYRPSTVSTQYRDHVKDLTCTSDNMFRTVIVDNNPFSFLLQPLNGIPCIPFSAGQPNDTQLLDVILPLLTHLSEQEDVRPILHDRFHMAEWFEKQGIPSTCWTS